MRNENIYVHIEETESFGTTLMRAVIKIYEHTITTDAIDVKDRGGRVRVVNELKNQAYGEVSRRLDSLKTSVTNEFYEIEKSLVDRANQEAISFEDDIKHYKRLRQEVLGEDDITRCEHCAVEPDLSNDGPFNTDHSQWCCDNCNYWNDVEL